jgi:hypothetical protein
MPDTSPAPRTLRLIRCKSADPGYAYGLKSGDVLIGVDGTRWSGSITALKARFSSAKGMVALTFLRGTASWSVLTDRLDLGQWEQIPLPADVTVPSVATDLLSNWEIVADAEWTHDVFSLRPSLFALAAPALWLAYHRLWTLLATLVAAMAVALPAGVPLVIGLWIAAGLHLWRSGAAHIRVDRAASGFHRVGVVAARSEKEAIAVWESLYPAAQFRFDKTPRQQPVAAAT